MFNKLEEEFTNAITRVVNKNQTLIDTGRLPLCDSQAQQSIQQTCKLHLTVKIWRSLKAG